MSLPLNVIIFATTMPKQCYGDNDNKYTYDKTIDSLFSKVDKNTFKNKILHLKSRPEDEKIAKTIKDFCKLSDVKVIETINEVKHHSENIANHSAEYFKDIYKAFSDAEIRKQKYTLWLEDDYLFREESLSLYDSFVTAIKYLDQNPDQLTVRYNQSNHTVNALEDYLDKDYHKASEDIFIQGSKYTEWGPTFTFQPNISRSNEIYIAWKAAQNYLANLDEYHCELMSGDILKTITESSNPFSFFNPKKIFSEHIG